MAMMQGGERPGERQRARFVSDQNVQHFNRLLTGEITAEQRRVISNLLAAEERKTKPPGKSDD